MADYRSPALQLPQRKPLPSANAGLQFHHSPSPGPHNRHPQAMRPQPGQNRPQTASSSFGPGPMHHPQKQMAPVYPAHHHSQQPHPQQPYPQQPHPQHVNPAIPIRRLSNATTSTASTGGNMAVVPGQPNTQADVRRSSSARSGSSQVGYVALMRKQKATVWCDRAQQEDPRVAAQRRAAKHRATLEVHGGGRSGTLGASGKIRHNTGSRTMTYNTGTMVGAGVPLRLSANEIGDAGDDSDDGTPFHRRTGSGRSSTGSNRFPSGYQRPQQGRFSSSSNSNTPPNTEPADGRPDIPEIVETPAPLKPDEDQQYFPNSANGSATNVEAPNADKAGRPSSTRSYGSDEEDNFGTIGEMAAPSGAVSAANRINKSEDLKRRGSVDDRSTSMTSQRLFIANPDLSD
ncbi:hypothetical protein FQN51_007920 [Onygenales sp. PD_10]|nr:hypothetical protein FQN51_007920 [Onygenales sp. PD_10]